MELPRLGDGQRSDAAQVVVHLSLQAGQFRGLSRCERSGNLFVDQFKASSILRIGPIVVAGGFPSSVWFVRDQPIPSMRGAQPGASD